MTGTGRLERLRPLELQQQTEQRSPQGRRVAVGFPLRGRHSEPFGELAATVRVAFGRQPGRARRRRLAPRAVLALAATPGRPTNPMGCPIGLSWCEREDLNLHGCYPTGT